MSSNAVTHEQASPQALPQPLTTICAALAGIGVVAFLYGLVSDPQVAWLAYHSNFIYFATLAQAGLILSCIFTIVGARWPGPIRRFAEGLGAWVPITLVLGVIGYFGGDYLFEWKREGAVHGKEVWLNPLRFYATDLGILALLTVLSMAFLKASVRPTLKGLADSGTGWGASMAQRWTEGWRGDAAEWEESAAKTRRMAPIICLIYALGYTFLVFDQVMSMEQTWFSNLFGAFVTWGGILCAVAALAVIGALHLGSADLGEHITRARRHDVGKMLFAFSIFWMYLFFSQYLVIWYGNLPEETQFFYDRLGPQFLIEKGFSEIQWTQAWSDWNWTWDRLNQGYGWLSMATWLCCWIIPFWVLLGEKPKISPWIAGPVGAIVMLGLWFERNLLVWPSVIKDGGSWIFVNGPIQIGIAAGFFGAFGLVFLIYTRVFPTVALPGRGQG